MGESGGLSFAGATEGYENDPQANLLNQVCILAFSALHKQRGIEKFQHMVEIGSGTGGTTSFVLPSFNPHTSYYLFSDLSQAFLTNARLRFATAFPFVEFAIYNGDKHPGDQGFHNHQAHQILSTNCIHATMHLASTMSGCHTFLGPGGAIIFNEVQNGGTLFEDLTFGLTDGWWMLTDCERRVTYPLMRCPEWLNLFSSCMFKNMWHTPDVGAFFSQQQVLVSAVREDEMPRTHIEVPEYPRCDPSGEYLITGAVGGLGLITAVIMMELGAKHLHFVSRRDRVPTEALQWYSRVTASNVNVKRERCNVSSKTEVQRVMTEEPKAPPLMGIVNGAGVLSDGTIVRQTRAKYQEVFGPKAFGGWHTYHWSMNKERPLQCNIQYSSGAGFGGSPGQSNHSAANTCLDAMADFSCAMGMPGGSIGWGAVAEVGYAARHSIGGDYKVPFEHAWAILEAMQMRCNCQVGISPGMQNSGFGRMPQNAAIFNGAAGRFRKGREVKAPKSTATASYLRSSQQGPGMDVDVPLPEPEYLPDDPAAAEYRMVFETIKQVHDYQVGSNLTSDLFLGQQEVC
jgi:hypothetical protein